MLLLTWHGTIMRLEKGSGRLSHARLVPRRDLAADLALDLPPGGLLAPLDGPGGMTLLPGQTPGTAHLVRDGKFLCVEYAGYPQFNRDKPGPWETLLPVPDATIALLRDLLSHAWVREDTGATIQPAEIALVSGPALQLPGLRVPLLTARPLADLAAPDTVTLPTPAGGLTLRRVPGSFTSHPELAITPQDPARVPDVPTEAAFRATSPARLTLDAPPELGIPPILGSLDDRDFLYRRGWHGLPPVSGRHQLNSQVVRERNKYVLLERRIEGMILDSGGVSNEYGYIGNLAGTTPEHFRLEGERYFLDHAALDAAPYLPGPHVVFYGGNYQNYYHWLIDAMVPLSLLAPYLPENATLLLPGSLAQFREKPIGKLDYIDVLDAFGFGGMKRVEMPGQIVRVEEVYWADRCFINQLPASALRTARDRALAGRPIPGGARRRLYIKRQGSRSVANTGLVEGIVSKHGCTPVLMESLTPREQIDLFRQAEFIVAPHGAALANLMFCQPGTTVLELSPDCEYRPFFNEICGKLGLTHAVLPCPTDDGGFNGRMTVNASRLHLMMNMLLSRRAA
jgi:hypothetical protein